MSQSTQDRRRFDRIATDKPVIVRAGDRQYTGTVLDISLRGLLLRIDSDWKPAMGDSLAARVELEGAMCCIELQGEVAHVEDGRIGLYSVSMDLASASRLRRLVELNLADEQLLERNLEQLITP